MKQLKLYLSIMAILVVALQSRAQNTGVNTKNPQGPFHVDAKKNNSATGTPVAGQETDDFMVDANGNVGMGILQPLNKLHLIGKIQIKDGGEKVGSVLTAVDNTGLAVWSLPSTIKEMVNGTFPGIANSPTITPDGVNNPPKDSGISITLTRGKWIVNAGITFTLGNVTIFQHCYLSTATNSLAQNGFNFLGPAGSKTCYGGVLYNGLANGPLYPTPMQLGFITGSTAIEVTQPSVVIHLLLQNQANGTYNFNARGYLENYFYARPID